MSYKSSGVSRGKTVFEKLAASVCVVALAMGMVPASAFAVVNEAASEAATEDVVVVDTELVEAGQVAQDAAAIEVDNDGLSAAFVQDNDIANSWRYVNGERSVQDVSTLSDESSLSAVANAWRLTDQGYVNERGGVIQGAVTKGIDVSEHQGVIDWDKVKADGVDFVIIRCAFYGDDGRGRADRYWERNVSECERLGIPYGVYVYSYCHSAEAARNAAARTVSLLQGHTLTFPVYFDIEESDYLTDVSKTKIADIAAAFCDNVESAGHAAGVYSSLYWWNDYLTDSRFAAWDRWVAQWSNQCDYKGAYHVWQCCSDGVIDGISGNIDVDFEMGWSCFGDQTNEFVERLYQVTLGREADSSGLRYHIGNLKQGQSAAKVARDFLMSSEFLSKDYTQEQRIAVAYKAMLDREAGAEEISMWMKVFDQNMTFDAVICAISNSQEWRNNCAAWNVSSAPATPQLGRDKNYAVTSYVNRLYQTVLGRSADLDGLDVQCDALVDGGSAAQTADAFFDSQEFKNKNYDNATQVELVYNTMLNRASDAAGKAEWVSHLDTGMTVRSVVYNLVNSAEFQARCAEWGVTPGSTAAVNSLYASLEPRDRNIGVTAFVYRMYVNCLGRNAATVRSDAAGENWQCDAILSGLSAGQIASNFFDSQEFANRNLSASAQVTTAYRAFFDRNPDTAGYDFWLAQVQSGMSSAELAAGFAESPEFANLCARYGVSV